MRGSGKGNLDKVSRDKKTGKFKKLRKNGTPASTVPKAKPKRTRTSKPVMPVTD